MTHRHAERGYEKKVKHKALQIAGKANENEFLEGNRKRLRDYMGNER